MKHLLALPALVALTLQAGAEEITLSNGEWPPFMSEHLPQGGVLSRVVREAFALEGVTVHYVYRPWARALAEAQSGKVQGSVVWGKGKNDSQRRRDFYFSDMVYEGRSVFFYLKDAPVVWNTYEDLKRYKVGGVFGYEYRYESIPGVHIDRAPTEELGMRKLLVRRYDVFPTNYDVGLYIMRTQFTPEEAARITSHPSPYSTTPYHLILPRVLPGSPALLARFNHGLQKLKESGRYAQYMADLEAGHY